MEVTLKQSGKAEREKLMPPFGDCAKKDSKTTPKLIDRKQRIAKSI